MIDIIYEDDSIIIVNKPAGIPIQNSKTSSHSICSILESKYGKIYLTHRLDQVVSGICVLTKTNEACQALNQQFADKSVQKRYLAVVNQGICQDTGSLSNKLLHDKKRHKAYVHEKGKRAELSYTKKATSDRYDCLEITIDGGRFHQIRCMLSVANMPIKGDVKYGARRKNKDRSIHLHALDIIFKHPKSQEIVHFSAPLPSENLWQFFKQQIEQDNLFVV